jgi:anti-sigma-K factor RskA
MTMPAPNDPELDTLLGAYALDALDDDERRRVDAYISANVAARDEVDELRESAAALALAPVDDATAPPDLWDRISDTIEGELAREAAWSENEGGDELAVRRGRRSVRWISWVATAAVVAALLLAAEAISLHRQLHDARATGPQAAAAAFVRAGRVDGARKVALAPASGAEVARVVLLPDGTGYLKSDRMAPLDAGLTYQLWALTGSAAHPVAISAGVLGPHPKAVAFQASTDVHAFAITIERAPGVAQSTQKPYASAALA